MTYAEQLVTLVTKIDPYVIAELSYWRSHWLRWPDRPIPAFLLDNRSDVTGLWPAGINKHVTQHLGAVEFRTSYSKDVIGLVARHNATCHHVDIS